MVLRDQLENPSPSLERAVAAYRRLDLTRPVLPPVRVRPPSRAQKRLTTTQVDKAVAGYRGGATLRQLGTQFGVSRHTISRHLKARGIRLRLSSPTPDEVERAVELYDRGWSLVKIATELPYDQGTIYNTLKRAGVRLRDTHGREHPARRSAQFRVAQQRLDLHGQPRTRVVVVDDGC